MILSGNTTAELREQDGKRKEEHAAVVEDLEEIKTKTMDTWGLIGMLEANSYHNGGLERSTEMYPKNNGWKLCTKNNKI